MTVRAKICGLSTPETVRAAADGGASHIGFNFFPKSPRYVELEAAAILAQPARARGVTVAGFANVPGAALLGLAAIPVLIETGPEVIAGSTRMGAATAQKAALNMVSVLAATRLGHIHDGYMVNLVADNIKLVDRAARIVAAVADMPRDAAEAALARVAGAVKPAVLVARGMTPEAATAALSQNGGHLAPLLQGFHQAGS